MGGSGSGNRHNHGWGTKTTVEACHSIDANRWTREGILKAGVRCVGYCPWPLRSGGTFRVDFDARCEDTRSATVRLSYSWTWNGGKDAQSED